MHLDARRRNLCLLLLVFVSLVIVPAATVQAQCCQVPDNGGGTATMPPNCSYFGPMRFSNGLPPGSQINIAAEWKTFASVTEVAGGALGGTTSTYTSVLLMQLSGTGALAGFNRTIALPLGNTAQNQIDSAPRTAFAPLQVFAAQIDKMAGQITFDPDFDLLRITAGNNFGMPSPGLTSMTQAGPNWGVSSYFDITYRIDFVGAPTGTLAGLSGSTTQVDRLIMCDVPVATAPSSWGQIKALHQ